MVSSGEEAIERAQQEQPDVVLMDISIRGEIDGIEAARQIRSHFGIPTIYITGYSDQDLKGRAQLAESLGFFVKPLEYRQLKLTIGSAVHKAVRDLRQKGDE